MDLPSTIIDWIVTIFVGAGGAFMKYLHGETVRNTKELNRLKVHIAENYPKSALIESRFKSLDDKLDRIIDKLDKKADRSNV